MTRKAKYQITNGNEVPFTFSVKPGSRIHETFEALRKGPVPAPAYTRRSDHVFRLRGEGIDVETEFRKQSEDGQERYGVYHLKSKVTPVSEVTE